MNNIAILGCGSVGSTLAEVLARLGHTVGYLIDKDVVESKNKIKSTYTEDDVGKHKVEILRNHLVRINPDLQINTINKFIEELTEQEWKSLLDETEVILEMADSRRGSEICVARVREYFEETGKQHIVVKMICLDNLAAGLTILWVPGSQNPCPCCLFRATPFVNTSDEREKRNNAEYTYDRITGYAVKGVLPDLLFGLSLTSSLIHGLILEMQGVNSGRKSVLNPFTQNLNITIWSPFRDPFLDWQKESKDPLMGSARPLTLESESSCPYCGLNTKPKGDPPRREKEGDINEKETEGS